MMMVEGEGEGEVEEGGHVEGGVGNGRCGETSHGYWKNSYTSLLIQEFIKKPSIVLNFLTVLRQVLMG